MGGTGRSARRSLSAGCCDKSPEGCEGRSAWRPGTISWMVPSLRIDHCVIAVSDWERSNAFYRDVLGAEVDQKDEWFAHYRFGTWQLNVHGPEFDGLNAAKPVEPGNSDLCFVWPGRIEEAVEHLVGHRVEIVAGPLDGDSAAGGRGRHVYFRDPDGSLLEFVSYS
jgi:catechol 2,3-dioxygenase-like lactoylglutathione lyase family enzyme